MEQLKFKQIYKEELAKLIEKMNKRHDFYMLLEQYKLNNGKIPNQYLPNWTAWVSDGRKHWRKVPGVMKRIKETARKAAENRMKKVGE
jgi:hypothetical protein